MKTNFFLFILVGVFSVSCKKENANVGLPAQPEIAIDSPDFELVKKDNYSIKIHKDWIVEQNTPDGVNLYIYIDGQDDFVENINLIVHDLGNIQYSLSDIENSAKSEFILIGGSIISSEKIITPFKQYQRLVVKAPYMGESLQYILHYIIQDSKLYVLTFTSLERDFNRYEKIAEQIMQSFEVK